MSKKCSTCDGLGVVATRWPSGYPHVTPCPECRPDVPCDCGLADCPSVEAIKAWKAGRGLKPVEPS